MKNRNLLIGAVVVCVAVGCLMVIARSSKTKPGVPQPAAKAAVAKAAVAAKAPVKKVFSKGMGGLTVRLVGAQNKPVNPAVRAFKVSDARSGVLMTAFPANRMQELLPGTYDIVVDTTPQMMYKNIAVVKEQETVADLSRPTGALIVKILNPKKKEGNYPLRVIYPGSSFMAASVSANRPLEIMAGVYDVEIGVTPKVVESGVKIEAGKDKVLDMGAITGDLIVKAVDDNMQEVRHSFRLRKQGKEEVVATGTSGRPMEILSGVYSVELLSKPPQNRPDVKIGQGEQAEIEFKVASVPVAAPKQAAPVAAPKKAAPAAAKTVPAAAPAKK